MEKGGRGKVKEMAKETERDSLIGAGYDKERVFVVKWGSEKEKEER
jgi:hypothetical protein